jgi:uncharacterized protein (TIGR00661 family)
MGTIYYGICGEGRGHATRSRVLIEALREQHRIVVCTYGDAWDLLAPLYAGSDVEVLRIPGLRFRYDSRGRVDYAQTGLRATPYLTQLPLRVRHWAQQLERGGADLVISDFEPLLARAAQAAHVPHVSVDHQHFLVSYDLSSLSHKLRIKAELLARSIRLFCSGQRRTIVSAFFFPPLRPALTAVTRAGVLLRREVQNAVPEQGRHFVAYVRRRAPRQVLESLASFGAPVRVYGHDQEGRVGNLAFHRIESRRFAEDLATSRALISSAGNQVVGEALALQKPVLAYPDPGNWEQEINAHFLEQSGTGRALPAERWSCAKLQAFVEELPALARHIRPEMMSGNAAVLRAIEAELNTSLKRTPCNASSLSPLAST